MSDIVTALRKMADGDWLADPVSPRRAADEIERLRAERDEARREVCQNEADEISMELGGAAIFASAIAKRRGWDCFKENTNG